MLTDEQMRYPIGDFIAPETYTPEDIAGWIDTIETLPGHIRNAVNGLTDAQFDTPYRKDGWTIRQVVHHVADSHMNCIVRIKLALTEDNPTIKPYEEHLWAQLPDYSLPVISSLQILEGIHQHLTILFKSFGPEQLERTFYHPGNSKTMPLKMVMALYAWHSKHHLAHITETVKRFG